ITPEVIQRRFMQGAEVVSMIVVDPVHLQNEIPTAILPLLLILAEDRLLIWTETDPPALRKGTVLIGLVKPQYYATLLEQDVITEKPLDTVLALN
ncbi:MAG: hypothetical protein WBC91_16015, partial [Phototrophicaceae bacterium]